MNIASVSAAMTAVAILSTAIISTPGHTRSLDPSAKVMKDTPLVILATETKLKSEDTEGTLRLPVARGGEAKVTRKINERLSPSALLGMSIKAIEKEFAGCSCGTVGAGYRVTMQRGPVLAVEVSIETMAAYPSGYETLLNFDTETGELLTTNDVFVPGKLDGLVTLVDARVQLAIEASIVHGKNEGVDEIAGMLEGAAFRKDDVKSFIFTDEGVAFAWDPEFPHVIQALSPAGHFLVPWAEAKPFLNKRFTGLAGD